MGKLGQQRRSRVRMTTYNIKKASQALEATKTKTRQLETEIVDLKLKMETTIRENLELKHENDTLNLRKDLEKEDALRAQEEYFSNKHNAI